MELKELRTEEDDTHSPPPLSFANVQLLLQEGPPTPWINRRKESRAEEYHVPLHPLFLLLWKFAPITQWIKRTATTKPNHFGLRRDSFASLYSQNWNNWSNDDKDGKGCTHIYSSLGMKEGEVCKELPIEVWGEIGKRLPSRLDILRFRSVCKSTRSSLPNPTRFPLRVPPLPIGGENQEDMPCVITEVSTYYQSHWDGGFVVLEEVGQGGKFRTHRRYRFSNSVAKIGCPAMAFTSWWRRRPSLYDRLSFISKAHHLRRAVPRTEDPTKWDCRASRRVEKIVVISSAGDGVNPCYAKQSDLSVVALVCKRGWIGRLALLRLGGPSWAWETDFCTHLFTDIARYKRGLCALSPEGAIAIMDFDDSGLLAITQVVFPYPLFCMEELREMYEDSGELYLTRSYKRQWMKYKLDWGKMKWVTVDSEIDTLMAHRARDDIGM